MKFSSPKGEKEKRGLDESNFFMLSAIKKDIFSKKEKIGSWRQADNSFKIDNVNGTKAVGLPISYYHFATLNTKDVVNDAKAEAQFFISQIKSLPTRTLTSISLSVTVIVLSGITNNIVFLALL
jgi:hypothetical protein